jgi:hypothetical protein
MSSALAFRGATGSVVAATWSFGGCACPGHVLVLLGQRTGELIESLFRHRHELIRADANLAHRVVTLPQQQKSRYHRDG